MPAHATGRPRPLLALAAGLLLAAAALMTAAGPAAAQEIRGVVRADDSGRTVEGAELQLLDGDGVRHATARTGADGRFRIAIPRPGVWVLAVEMIGYQRLASEPFQVDADAELTVDIRLGAGVVPLDPIVVRGRRPADIGGFQARMAQGRRSGMGHYLDRDDIDRLGGSRPTDLLRTVAGVRIARGVSGRGAGIRMSGNCVPAIFVDGAHLNRFDRRESLDDYVSVFDIEGIEVYRGVAQGVPQYRDASGCGVVLVWTRRGTTEDGFRPSWVARVIILGVISGLYFLLN